VNLKEKWRERKREMRQREFFLRERCVNLFFFFCFFYNSQVFSCSQRPQRPRRRGRRPRRGRRGCKPRRGGSAGRLRRGGCFVFISIFFIRVFFLSCGGERKGELRKPPLSLCLSSLLLVPLSLTGSRRSLPQISTLSPPWGGAVLF